jgi:hypothetical protein
LYFLILLIKCLPTGCFALTFYPIDQRWQARGSFSQQEKLQSQESFQKMESNLTFRVEGTHPPQEKGGKKYLYEWRHPPPHVN